MFLMVIFPVEHVHLGGGFDVVLLQLYAAILGLVVDGNELLYGNVSIYNNYGVNI